jgi:hypothetical protein
MTRKDHDRVEISAQLRIQAQGLLHKARSWLLVLGDVKRASTLNRVINDIDAERRRWLRAVDDPFS